MQIRKTRRSVKDQKIIFLYERALSTFFKCVERKRWKFFTEARVDRREIWKASTNWFQRGADDRLEKSFYCRRGLISQRRWSIDSIQERPVVVWSRLAGWSSSLFQPWSAANSTDRSLHVVWASFRAYPTHIYIIDVLYQKITEITTIWQTKKRNMKFYFNLLVDVKNFFLFLLTLFSFSSSFRRERYILNLIHPILLLHFHQTTDSYKIPKN